MHYGDVRGGNSHDFRDVLERSYVIFSSLCAIFDHLDRLRLSVMFRSDALILAFLLLLDLSIYAGSGGVGCVLALSDLLHVVDTGLNDLKQVLKYVDDVRFLPLTFLH